MKLPIDQDGNVVPAVSFKEDGAHQISASTTTARNSTEFAAYGKNQGRSDNEDATHRIISMFCSKGFHFKSGDDTVTATTSDHYFPANVYYDFAVPIEHTNIAVILASGTATVYLSEKG